MVKTKAKQTYKVWEMKKKLTVVEVLQFFLYFFKIVFTKRRCELAMDEHTKQTNELNERSNERTNEMNNFETVEATNKQQLNL